MQKYSLAIFAAAGLMVASAFITREACSLQLLRLHDRRQCFNPTAN